MHVIQIYGSSSYSRSLFFSFCSRIGTTCEGLLVALYLRKRYRAQIDEWKAQNDGNTEDASSTDDVTKSTVELAGQNRAADGEEEL